jgi:hypothetical protein
MGSKTNKSFSWKDVHDLVSAKRAIDTGILLGLGDSKRLCKTFDDENLKSIIEHLTIRLGERCSDRLATEILVETLLAILTTAGKESLLVCFLESAINSTDFERMARVFVEVSLSSEVSGDEDEINSRATAVALICELGFSVQQIEDESPGHLEKGRALLDHIATYLLSVGNTSIQAVRLCLLRYFSQSEYGLENKPGFTKIMGRFGHTMFDSLFQQLFNKKSEAMALRYLLDNLPTALEATGDSQMILHETFKQYMMKYPERFSLFMHEMGQRVLTLNPSDATLSKAAESYYRHLVSLFKVTSDLDHKSLGKELLSEIFRFEKNAGCLKYTRELQKSLELRKNFRDLVVSQSKDASSKKKQQGIVSQFRMSKRGRKPTLNTKSNAGFLEQVMSLGQWEYQKSA